MSNNYLWEVFKKAAVNRNFELKVFENVKNKNIKLPVYLSAGQETISASLSEICKIKKIKPLLFPQHRCHSIYMSFGGNIKKLIFELLGSKKGCTNGMGGSASIHSKTIKMFGHDGHMGTQAPIATGACFESKKPTLVFLGDASAEEDYVLGALGWASTKKLPILFVVEDNNLSILTKKKVRRNWHMHDVAKSFKMKGYDINDDPNSIRKYSKFFFKEPMLLNINTHRLFWHSGAGIDSDKIFDRYKSLKKFFGKKAIEFDNKINKEMSKIWAKTLDQL
ncbi:thiamine pyrophosphate-dependent enzyme [Candidatus Pelagibacter sp.]|nr:thiamine pyrophosphate-dependent enzyme [Candidatus Pelagibacter sp.]|tara:strand:+ start:8455 stop:9291 length:837 start_codon:yes stop_codon:yes gene_type:complete